MLGFGDSGLAFLSYEDDYSGLVFGSYIQTSVS